MNDWLNTLLGFAVGSLTTGFTILVAVVKQLARFDERLSAQGQRLGQIEKDIDAINQRLWDVPRPPRR